MKSTVILAVLSLFLSACSPIQPTPECESCDPIDPQAGPVYFKSNDLLIAESYPVQIFLHLTGDLPTPCHELRGEMAAPDEENRILITAWSESDPEAICVQMLEPFDVNWPIRMEGADEGTYTVYLNGELVGEFNYPA